MSTIALRIISLFFSLMALRGAILCATSGFYLPLPGLALTAWAGSSWTYLSTTARLRLKRQPPYPYLYMSGGVLLVIIGFMVEVTL